jgi:serine/threonine protein phosphatase PrpC
MVVADGMGGHAGGDVASHVVIRQMLELDRPFDSPEKARKILRDELLKINALLIGAVVERPELAGLGTTVSVLLRVGNKAVIAHIGDSRCPYLPGCTSAPSGSRQHDPSSRLRPAPALRGAYRRALSSGRSS